MYLRSEYEDGHVAVILLSSKTRVAPIKQTTWYTNLSKTFLQPVAVTPREIKQTFWVNSTTVICRTKQGKSWKQYVQNHTPEVHKTVPEAAWNYCPVPKIELVYILWLIWTGTFRELTVVEWTRVSKEPRQQMAKSPQVQADNKEAMIKLVKCPLLCS